MTDPKNSRGGCRSKERSEGVVLVDGQEMYLLAAFDEMRPFLMSIVSDSDLWMYMSSHGGLTAGRTDEDHSLFPYDTDDKILNCHWTAGPYTLLRVQRGKSESQLWEPFRAAPQPGIVRNLYKGILGNSVMFEENHAGLGMSFSYRWNNCDEYGFVRTCVLRNLQGGDVQVKVVDGLINVLPAGVEWRALMDASCAINAFCHSEVDGRTALGIYSMSSLLADRPEPREALWASVEWSEGLPRRRVLLSTDQLPAFRQGQDPVEEPLLVGRRGAYLVASDIDLAAGQAQRWCIVADTALSQSKVVRLRQWLSTSQSVAAELTSSIRAGSENLRRNVAIADGLQMTADKTLVVHHFANVLFNNMRGGVYADGYSIQKAEFVEYLQCWSPMTLAACHGFVQDLPDEFDVMALVKRAGQTGSADLRRLAHEFLPLVFGRRHGDPSRPWNRFCIQLRHPDGRRRLCYQGNWRDIFQNWEALSVSYPRYLPSIIAKFVNASTADGFNPYRITHEGIDWEVADPKDHFNYFGYWGDHQIVYLLRLLESLARCEPGRLERMWNEPIFSYANVPYRLKPYADLLRDGRNTLTFDSELDAQIRRRVARMGADGRLMLAADGGVYHVSLAEKLLVPLLSKLSNLVPDGGIWMNTQRPEWNDSNNALVGRGLSMVTLYHLRRYVGFLQRFMQDASEDLTISTEVATWLCRVATVLEDYRPLLKDGPVSDEDRKSPMDALGNAFGEYRQKVYATGFSGQRRCRLADVHRLLAAACEHLDHAIANNRRTDGLYQSYNLLAISTKRASVANSREMLEGQVAILASGALDGRESLDLIETLFSSLMYRPDQDSFMLYPAQPLPLFLNKNIVPSEHVERTALLKELLSCGDGRIITRDTEGKYRFAGGLRNAAVLEKELDLLGSRPEWVTKVAADRQAVMDIYEEVFNHKAFMGRSSRMYSYEGIGCIYWHMVAKLLLAVQECYVRACTVGESPEVQRGLAQAYHRVRHGLGFNKSVREYGTFPTDPYSHTPAHSGAQQPGMTGQVKEEILTRFGELGIVIQDGQVSFRPRLLRQDEFVSEPRSWQYCGLDGQWHELMLEPRSLAFTYCQVPVVYRMDGVPGELWVTTADGSVYRLAGSDLGAEFSRELLDRSGRITMIMVTISRL